MKKLIMSAVTVGLVLAPVGVFAKASTPKPVTFQVTQSGQVVTIPANQIVYVYGNNDTVNAGAGDLVLVYGTGNTVNGGNKSLVELFSSGNTVNTNGGSLVVSMGSNTCNINKTAGDFAIGC
jgi:hypothetical protein